MLNHPQIKEFQKSLAIVFFALLAGQVIFALVSLGLVSQGMIPAEPQLRNIGLIVIPFLVFFGFMGSRLIGSRMLMKARMALDTEDKFNQYRSAFILRLALLETPGFFAIVAFMLTGERIFLGFLSILLFYFVTLFPSESKIIAELGPEDENYRSGR
ncbi:MAG: hypothetical protein RBS07_06475 [Lentimicrobium sp.]|jgi:hypothetical protein|nr:hypothetical protein [Lentimicrobium sp.]